MDIHIRDSNFFSDKYPERPNPYINWIWDRVPKHNDVTVFTDCHLNEVFTNSSPIKIAYLIEPPAINSDMYAFIRENYDAFTCIFTYDDSLAPISNKFVVIPHGTSWIQDRDKKVYPKSKMTSIIASGKNWAEGHRLRHSVIASYRNSLDVMGNGYRAIDSKLEGLIPYRYQLVIENSKLDLYFTEKIMDCFFTGVVPIYWGCPKVMGLFDPNGIITFDTIEHVGVIFKGISEEDYLSRMAAIQYNLKKAEEYVYQEKYMVDVIKQFFKGEQNV